MRGIVKPVEMIQPLKTSSASGVGAAAAAAVMAAALFHTRKIN